MNQAIIKSNFAASVHLFLAHKVGRARMLAMEVKLDKDISAQKKGALAGQVELDGSFL